MVLVLVNYNLSGIVFSELRANTVTKCFNVLNKPISDQWSNAKQNIRAPNSAQIGPKKLKKGIVTKTLIHITTYRIIIDPQKYLIKRYNVYYVSLQYMEPLQEGHY